MGAKSVEPHVDDLPPEDRAAARAKIKSSRDIKPTDDQIALALQVFEIVKDYSKVSTLISVASHTLEDALKRE